MIINLIVKLFTFVTDLIFSLLGTLIPLEMPSGLIEALEYAFNFMESGLSIINFFCSIGHIQTVLEFWLIIWTLDHTYGMVMWIFQKIPMLNIK